MSELKPKLSLYKRVGGSKIFVAEIDQYNGAPKRIFGMNPRTLVGLIETNLRALGITQFILNTDPNERHHRFKESENPESRISSIDPIDAKVIEELIKKIKL